MTNGLSSFEITKANGEKSILEPDKLLNSLLKSGAQKDEAHEIVTVKLSDL